jgi:aminopeptidase N
MSFSKITIFAIACFCLSACSLLGINLNHHAPVHAGKYPKFTQKDSLRGSLNTNRSCFDVTFYELNVSFDYDKKTIEGVVNITAKAENDFKTLQLDLQRNMTVNSVQYLGESLKFIRKDDYFVVEMPKTMPKNSHFTLQVAYQGKPVSAKRPPWEGGFVWKKDAKKNPWIGVACEQLGASSWFPLKDYLGDEPDSVAVNLTIPKGLVAVSNGQFVGSELNTVKNTETFKWKTSYPINHYDITFYIGNFQHFEVPYRNFESQFTMSYYVLAENVEKAKAHFTQANDIIKVYEKLFGDYPWPRDGYRLVESPYAGMEHQSGIAYGNGYKNGGGASQNVDYIILHETAHEWWGNAVSVGDFADVWIHEGLATYSEALYIEKTEGFDAYLRYLFFYGISVANKKPMVGPRGVNYWDYKDGDPYVKGAMMLMSLRTTIDDDKVFFDILKTFQARFRGKIVTSEDFITIVNEKTASDYHWFFTQFLYNRKPARLVAKRIKKATTIQISYYWEDANKDFKMPVYLNDGKRLQRLNVTTTPQIYTVKNPDEITWDNLRVYYRH